MRLVVFDGLIVFCFCLIQFSDWLYLTSRFSILTIQLPIFKFWLVVCCVLFVEVMRCRLSLGTSFAPYYGFENSLWCRVVDANLCFQSDTWAPSARRVLLTVHEGTAWAFCVICTRSVLGMKARFASSALINFQAYSSWTHGKHTAVQILTEAFAVRDILKKWLFIEGPATTTRLAILVFFLGQRYLCEERARQWICHRFG